MDGGALIHLYIHIFIHSYIYVFIYSYIYIFIHSYIQYTHSYIHSFIHCFSKDKQRERKELKNWKAPQLLAENLIQFKVI